MSGTVHIGEDTFLGTGAVVLPNIRLGARATIGAGAVVITDVNEATTVAGNPARIIKQAR